VTTGGATGATVVARGWERNLSRLLAGIISSLVLTLAVVLGLLTVPSTCGCGVELPHPHALYLLAHHHHDEDGHVDDSAPAPPSSASPAIVEGSIDGPSMLGMTASAVGDAFAAVIATALVAPVVARRAPRPLVGLASHRRSHEIAPDVPPPRSGATRLLPRRRVGACLA